MKKAMLLVLVCILIFSACARNDVTTDVNDSPTASEKPIQGSITESVMPSESSEPVITDEPIADLEPHVEETPTFVPDYVEGEQNTVWGNLPTNLDILKEYSSIAKQGDYLYYSFYRHSDNSSSLFKMPVDATSSEDVVLLADSSLLNGCVSDIQVLGDWIYFCVPNGYQRTIYKIRTDGECLEPLLILKYQWQSTFIVFQRKLYYTEIQKEHITANTYEYHNRLMSFDLDTKQVTCEGDINKQYTEFELVSMDTAGYLFIYASYLAASGDWYVYDLKETKLSTGDKIDYRYIVPGDNGNVYSTNGSTIKAYNSTIELLSGQYFQNYDSVSFSYALQYGGFASDGNGFYYVRNSDPKVIYYYNEETNDINEVCADRASYMFLPGDGYLYYQSDQGWCRIATVNGSEGTDWEFIDWMSIPGNQ